MATKNDGYRVMIESLRRAFAAVAIVATLSLGAAGAALLSAPSARADQAADDASAQSFIGTLADKALVLVNSKTVSDADRTSGFRTLFVASFDIPDIGRFVLGRHWKTATPDQQKDFLNSFEEYTVLTWSTRFKDYTGVRFEVQGASPADDGFVIVQSRILRSQGDPLEIGWRVHRVDGGWRITDILIENVSMALTQRQDFAASIQSSGGSVESLLVTMHKKIEELRAHSAS
jgi:phospholipid transport system substrate-binding protein